MSTGMVGADAEALERAAVEMRAAADDLDQQEIWLSSSLSSVAWIGDVAGRFLDAWASGHRPRLRSTADIIRERADLLLQQAADQRSTSESGGDAGSGGGPGGSGGPSGDPLDDPDAVPTDEIFSEDYMEDFIDTEVEGADDPELNDALEELLNEPDPERVDELLDQIADARGVDPEALRADYEQYLALRDQMIADGHEIGTIDLDRHPDFLGSTWSLRYGTVVGDALGIDPVFAALLNPTGGLVGSGNSEVPILGSLAPVQYHGVFHDAGGFLYKNFDMGPGYSYIEGDHGDPGDPLSGQVDGLQYWADTWSAHKEAEFGNWLQDRFEDAGDWAGDRFDDAQDWTGDRVEDGRDLLEGGRDLVEDGWKWLT